MSKRIFFILLIGLFCLANVTRWGFRSRIANPRFVAEGAAHYRYMELIAHGERIAPLDRQAQWPEGLRVFHETSIGMEYLYGLLYRMLPGRKPPLPEFVRFVTACFFSLAIFPTALLAVRLWRGTAAGVITAALFAVVLPLVGRSSGFELIRENVTFPLIIAHSFFLVTGWESGGWRRPILSGLLLALALASWQGTQFYLVPLLLFLLVRMIVSSVSQWERRTVRVLVVCTLAAGVLVPFLRSSGFLLSIPVALSVACLVLDYLHHSYGEQEEVAGGAGPFNTRLRNPLLGVAAACIAGCCILVPAVFLKGHFASYSHFFKLILYKLRYVDKPSDPRVLPFDVRSFWVGPFQSPDPRHIFVFALPLILLLPGPLTRLYYRSREGEAVALFTLVFLIVFFVLFLLMMRLLPLFGFFAVLAAGGVTREVQFRRRGVGASLLFAACTGFVLCISLLQDFAWEGRADLWRRFARILRIPAREQFIVYPVAGDVEGKLLSWIRRNTPENAVVLTSHYLSPQVLTYTGRATNLNDFFETPRMRRKAERFMRLLYSDEESLLAFCKEQSSDYVLVSAAVGSDPTRDSPLYQAGFMDMPPGCAAYRMLFEPERLRHFNLVYENEMYRLFHVGEAYAMRRWPRSPLLYERELLWHLDGDISGFYHSAMHIYALTRRGDFLIEQGRKAEGEADLVEALRIFYFYPAWRALADLYRHDRRLGELESLALFAYRYDPNRGDVCLTLAGVRLELGNLEGIDELFEHCAVLPLSRGQVQELRDLRKRYGHQSGKAR
ncbi:MAG: hypothetical protein JSV33_16105 [bacterium]|nr:MAG: hypothetical protein JSV33_16105 [bacterium]